MKPNTVDEYIDSFPDDQKIKLAELREIIRTVLPDTDETLKWGQPAIIDKDGMILAVFSGHKQHMNLVVTPSTKEAFEKELSGYETGKGSVKLPYNESLPASLIEELVLYRTKEYRKQGVKWM